MSSQQRSTAINVWSSDRVTTLFKIKPESLHTEITNGTKRLDISAPVRVFDKAYQLVDPIDYADNVVKDSSGESVSMDDIQTLLSSTVDSSGNVVADLNSINTNSTTISTHTTEIADLLARVVVLENQMSELNNP